MCLASKNTLPITPYGTGNKRKSLPEEKYDDELSAGIGYDSSLSPLVIDGYLKFGDVIGGNCSLNRQLLSQQDWGLNNGDMGCGNGFIISHNLSQCNYLGSFKEMDGDVENCDVISGPGSMNNHSLYQQNGLKKWIN